MWQPLLTTPHCAPLGFFCGNPGPLWECPSCDSEDTSVAPTQGEMTVSKPTAMSLNPLVITTLPTRAKYKYNMELESLSHAAGCRQCVVHRP